MASTPQRRFQPIREVTRGVRLALTAIAWGWLLIFVLAVELPTVLQAYPHGMWLALGMFLAGTCLGILLERFLSGGEIEMALVPVGSTALSLALWDLSWGERAWFSWDLTWLGAGMMLYTIPLQALVRSRARPETRAEIASRGIVLNGVFVLIACSLVTARSMGLWSRTDLLSTLAVCHGLITLYIFAVIPEFLMRFVVWILACTVYRVRIVGRENIPTEAAAILVANHVSYIDWFVLTVASRRPVRFVMYYKYYDIPVLKHFFRAAGAIPIAGGKEDPQIKERAFRLTREALANHDLICIFPEGGLTHDGRMAQFRPGVERMLQESPQVPVVPMALCGLWGSFFTRSGGRAFVKIPRPSRRIIEIVLGEPIFEGATAATLEGTINALREGRAP